MDEQGHRRSHDMVSMASKKDIKRTGWREVLGILLLAASILVFLSQISYLPADVSLLQWPPQRPAANFVGPTGAWIAFGLFMAFGMVAYVVPFAAGACGLWLVLATEGRIRFRVIWLLLAMIALSVVMEMQEGLWRPVADRLNLPSAGGTIGYFAGERGLVQAIGEVGTAIVCTVVLLCCVIFLLDLRPRDIARHTISLLRRLAGRAHAAVDARRERHREIRKESKALARQRKKLERSVRDQQEGAPAAPAAEQQPVFARTVEDLPPDPDLPDSDEDLLDPVLQAPPIVSVDEKVPAPAVIPPAATRPLDREAEAEGFYPLASGPQVEYRLPTHELLDVVVDEPAAVTGPDLSGSSRVLEETLKDFGIACKVTNVERGPVVTRFEVLPAAGVRVERIAGLGNNIALALKAISVRVQAPIPGKGVVGIEVPNSTKSGVFLRQLTEEPTWDTGRFALPLAMGKDVGGRPLISDLAAMPHLLIAGATGAGKSVCINSILAGLLMARTPEQMRLMLVDPKIVEFACYEGLPHLVVPVITDPKKVAVGLRWAINEMEKRYKIFAKVGVRNIRDFNHRPRAAQTDLFGEEQPASRKEKNTPDTLPYIAIIIDELADLMLVAQAEVENAIARLAQLSRAVGIHMIIATQRPSVNVITGTIKANFPARLAFQVAQKVDSRTILDAIGAENLLGKGDMLFLPPGGNKTVRAQGAYVSDEEIKILVRFWTDQAEPDFVTEIQEKIESRSVDIPEAEADDELMEAAVEVIRQTRRASTSSLQRRLRIGYTRAARLMDVLEEKGIIGPPQGSDPREILIDLDGDIPHNPPAETDQPIV